MSFFSRIGRLIYQFTLHYGVVGLGIGTFLESFGIPTAAVVIELAGGALIISGRTTFLTALIVSTTGLTLGSLASYYVGYLGSQAYGKLRPLEGRGKSKAREYLVRYGAISILFAQLFGPARTWISLPAGAMRLDIKRFTIYTAIGGAVYCSIAIGVSIFLTRLVRDEIDWVINYISPPGLIVLIIAALLAATIAWRFLFHRRKIGSAERVRARAN